jgi:hypothetical protein
VGEEKKKMTKNIVKSFALIALLMACGVSLWAQSTGPDRTATVTLAVGPLDDDSANVVPDENPYAAATTPLIVNVLTVIGVNSTGVPCYNCVANAASPNIGLLSPSGVIKRGGAPSQVDVFLYDQTYTGSCTFTIEIVDKAKTVVASTNPTFSFTAPRPILLGTALAVPSTAAVGMGRVQTTAVCGTSTTKSGSPVYISK